VIELMIIGFIIARFSATAYSIYIFFSTGFYSPYRTLAFLNGLLDPQTFGRTPCLGDQSNTIFYIIFWI
jgi:hypothetical protein